MLLIHHKLIRTNSVESSLKHVFDLKPFTDRDRKGYGGVVICTFASQQEVCEFVEEKEKEI